MAQSVVLMWDCCWQHGATAPEFADSKRKHGEVGRIVKYAHLAVYLVLDAAALLAA